jgi:hypothetical protein
MGVFGGQVVEDRYLGFVWALLGFYLGFTWIRNLGET